MYKLLLRYIVLFITYLEYSVLSTRSFNLYDLESISFSKVEE